MIKPYEPLLTSINRCSPLLTSRCWPWLPAWTAAEIDVVSWLTQALVMLVMDVLTIDHDDPLILFENGW